MMTVLPALRRGKPALHNITRRRVLRCAAVLFAGTAISPMPWRVSFAADADAQWARLQRGLSQKTMAGCRKAADRLMPRLGALLKGPQWESQMFKAVADELKQAGVYPDRPPPLSPDCAESLRSEAESLRGEAASTKSSDGAIEAGLAVAAAVVATIPGVGPVIAAVLVAIAAVIILVGQLIAKALEDQAAAKEKDPAAQKEKEEQATKIKKLKKRVTDEMARRDDCISFGKKPD
jgi:Na+-transporting methylmalonyl-CoA/oxaloacetate decarboxylase gamma subunit